MYSFSIFTKFQYISIYHKYFHELYGDNYGGSDIHEL